MSDETTTEHLDAPPPISAELRAKILSDPNVAKMAESLQVPLEEFVNQVGYYLNNPGVEPAFLVVSDENLKKMGVEPPTEAALEANVRQTVAALKVAEMPSGFTAHKKNTVEMPSAGGESLTGKSDPDLEDTVKKARFPSKG
jgi:hypothetical protein